MKMRHHIILAVFVLTLALVSPSYAEEGAVDAHTAAAEAYFAGDYALAMKLYTPLAEKDDAEAQFNLGVMNQLGQGTDKNDKAAVKWFEKSAALGNPEAQVKLGEMYHEGKGVEKNSKTAAELYAKAADAGSPAAMNNLAYLYYLGEGVKQDFNIARKMFERAADKGVADAQYNLGTMYDEGKGMEKPDSTTAVGWFLKAAAQGNPEAQFALGYLHFSGRGVEPNTVEAYKWLKLAVNAGKEEAVRGLAGVTVSMSKEQIAEGDKLVEAWKPAGEKKTP
jgi:uncharacterized protein